MPETEPAVYLTMPEVAERYRTTVEIVRYWRKVGYGPNGVKLGQGRGRRVLYPIAEIERFDRQLAQGARAAAAALA